MCVVSTGAGKHVRVSRKKLEGVARAIVHCCVMQSPEIFTGDVQET